MDVKIVLHIIYYHIGWTRVLQLKMSFRARDIQTIHGNELTFNCLLFIEILNWYVYFLHCTQEEWTSLEHFQPHYLAQNISYHFTTPPNPLWILVRDRWWLQSWTVTVTFEPPQPSYKPHDAPSLLLFLLLYARKLLLSALSWEVDYWATQRGIF